MFRPGNFIYSILLSCILSANIGFAPGELLAEEKNRPSLLQKNGWLTTEELEGEWGKEVKAMWNGQHQHTMPANF